MIDGITKRALIGIIIALLAMVTIGLYIIVSQSAGPVARSTYNVPVYVEQGGEKLVVESSGSIEVQSGGALAVAGDTSLADVTASGDVDIAGDTAITGTLTVTGATTLTGTNAGDVSGGNYTAIESAGTLHFYGDATVFDDIRVPVNSTKLGGTKDPDFAVWQTDGSGSQGVFIYWFDKTIEEELYFTVQMPHGWKTGTDIGAHLHWTPAADGAEGAVVSWGLEYTWVDIGAIVSPTTIITSITTTAGDASLAADKHYLTELGDIDGSGHSNLSSMLVCRVYREAGAVADDYDNDAGILEVDFHYEIDQIGSESEYIK